MLLGKKWFSNRAGGDLEGGDFESLCLLPDDCIGSFVYNLAISKTTQVANIHHWLDWR